MGIFLNTCRDTVQERLVQVHMIASTCHSRHQPLKNNVKTLKMDILIWYDGVIRDLRVACCFSQTPGYVPTSLVDSSSFKTLAATAKSKVILKSHQPNPSVPEKTKLF